MVYFGVGSLMFIMRGEGQSGLVALRAGDASPTTLTSTTARFTSLRSESGGD